jgi:Na+(H+)/acetate symporter ActP
MKKFLAVIAGLTVAFVVVSVGTLLSIKNFGQLNLDSISLDSIKEMVRSLSVLGLILVIVSHAVGSLAGGVTVGRILKEDTMNVGLTLGAIMTILGLVNMIAIPTYPEWFYLDFIVYIPLSMFGANYTSKL